MTRDYLRWGVLGASKFALVTMIPALHRAKGGVVAALASRSADKAAPARAAIPNLALVDDYDALLQSDAIDAVYIPLPNHLHAPWALKAMAAGKHVLVEKPVGMSVAEIDSLIEARDRTGAFCAEALMIAHHPQWTDIRGLIDGGAIGPLRHIAGHFTYYKNDPANIRARADFGGGALRDIGVYPLAAARLATGAEPVIGHVAMDVEGGVDIRTRVQASFGAVSFDFLCSMRMHRQQEMQFFGEAGTIIVRAPFNPGDYAEGVVEIRRPGGAAEQRYYTGADQYVLQAEAFSAAARAGAPFACPLEFSRGNQRAIDAIFAAAAR